jgi:hypothetical protein
MKAAKPAPIPFEVCQELEPVAVIFLLMKAATIALKRHHPRHRKDQLDDPCAYFIMMAPVRPCYFSVAARGPVIDGRVLRVDGLVLEGLSTRDI